MLKKFISIMCLALSLSIPTMTNSARAGIFKKAGFVAAVFAGVEAHEIAGATIAVFVAANTPAYKNTTAHLAELLNRHKLIGIPAFERGIEKAIREYPSFAERAPIIRDDVLMAARELETAKSANKEGAKTRSNSPFDSDPRDGKCRAVGWIDPNTVRFSQDSIKGSFSDGKTVQMLIDGLKSGAIKPDLIPAINVFERNGNLFTLDNRRLYAFRQAGLKIKYKMVPYDPTDSEILRKMTTKNDGTSIRIRGEKGCQ
ncbi:hypothetical protein [Methylosinus sp. RM1]|uniref:hypothetical protein n=1 Tax=Methylosinus sp. RM1 TaxID=2583817 RepID=UPI00140A33C1|nr:hypothetical protein [Methylosinus sp. RM1]